MIKLNRKILIILSFVLVFSLCSINVFADEVTNNVIVEPTTINGYGIGVSSVPPAIINTTIQPYGSSPPAIGGAFYSLNNGSYNGTIEWMTSYMYSNVWVGTSTTTISLYSNMRVYATKENAINKNSPLINTNTVTRYRLVGSDGSSTSWKSVTNNSSGTIDFPVTADMTYYLQIDPVDGYYTSGTFMLSRK